MRKLKPKTKFCNRKKTEIKRNKMMASLRVKPAISHVKPAISPLSYAAIDRRVINRIH